MAFGKKHLDHLVSEYLVHYNELRPHQSLDNRPLTGAWPNGDDPLESEEQIICHERLGGVLRHYERVAACVNSPSKMTRPTLLWINAYCCELGSISPLWLVEGLHWPLEETNGSSQIAAHLLLTFHFFGWLYFY
jgi:hypothetical protein